MNLTGVMDYPLGSAVVIPRMVTFLSYDWLAFDLQRTILATWHRFAFKGERTRKGRLFRRRHNAFQVVGSTRQGRRSKENAFIVYFDTLLCQYIVPTMVNTWISH